MSHEVKNFQQMASLQLIPAEQCTALPASNLVRNLPSVPSYSLLYSISRNKKRANVKKESWGWELFFLRAAATFGKLLVKGCVRGFLKLLRYFFPIFQMTRTLMSRPTTILQARNLGLVRPPLAWIREPEECPTSRCMSFDMLRC